MNDEDRKSVVDSLVSLAKVLTEGEVEDKSKRARLTAKETGRKRLTSKEAGRERLTQRGREASREKMAVDGFVVGINGNERGADVRFYIDYMAGWYSISESKKKMDWVQKMVDSIMKDAPMRSGTRTNDVKMGASAMKKMQFRVIWEILFDEENSFENFVDYLEDNRYVKRVEMV